MAGSTDIHADDGLRASVVHVAVDALAEAEGIIAEEVRAKDGAVILPAGVDITMFSASMRTMIRKMQDNGIDRVCLHQHVQLSESDIESIIERAYSDKDAIIDKEKAAYIVKEVDALFTEFKKEEINSEVIAQLDMMSEDLAYDVMRDQSLAFSLGKVKEADEYTFIHSFNVSVLTGYLANRLHPGDKKYVERIIMGGLLHDIGKAQIPNEVLNKPGPLTNDEFAIMKSHPSLGVTLAMKSGVTDPDILAVIGGHHEKWSGRGYPNELAGTDIPESARIAAVADVFDALTAKRVYKQPMSSRNALAIIMKDAGMHFDSKVVRELLLGLGLYPPGSIVKLSDGRHGVVVSGGGKDLMRPVVLIQHANAATADEAPEFVDLKETDVIISEYLGHGSKRELSLRGAAAS